MITRIHTTTELEKEIGRLTFARVLKAWRECEEMPQKELAKKLGITASTLADLESGRRIPSLKRAEKIAKAMGATPQHWVQLALQDFISKSGVNYQISVEVA